MTLKSNQVTSERTKGPLFHGRCPQPYTHLQFPLYLSVLSEEPAVWGCNSCSTAGSLALAVSGDSWSADTAASRGRDRPSSDPCSKSSPFGIRRRWWWATVTLNMQLRWSSNVKQALKCRLLAPLKIYTRAKYFLKEDMVSRWNYIVLN